jgi:hypothetical protein
MKLIFALILVCASFAFAQEMTPVAPAVVAASAPIAVIAAPATGILGWIQAHGGFQAAILFIVMSTFTALSALRKILYAYDGVKEGDTIPADKTTLTTVNKICLVLGSVVDFIQGNTKHT